MRRGAARRDAWVSEGIVVATNAVAVVLDLLVAGIPMHRTTSAMGELDNATAGRVSAWVGLATADANGAASSMKSTQDDRHVATLRDGQGGIAQGRWLWRGGVVGLSATPGVWRDASAHQRCRCVVR